MTQLIESESISKTQNSRRDRIQEQIQIASSLVAPVWPLTSAVACNPLLHVEDRNFWDAISENQKFAFQNHNEKSSFVNLQLIKWLQAFLDEGQAYFPMPSKSLGFYGSWKDLARFDADLIETKDQTVRFDSLPHDPLSAVCNILSNWQIDDLDLDSFFKKELCQLPGWAGYIRWRSDWSGKGDVLINLTHLLAVRLAIAWVRFGDSGISKKWPIRDQRKQAINRSAIETKESDFASALFRRLKKTLNKEFHIKSADAQFVFCIDVRSEPFRRQLESLGAYETFGFAGFFAVPVQIHQEKAPGYASCPVLLKPQWSIFGSQETHRFNRLLKSCKSFALQTYKELKYRFGPAFSFVETIGFWSGLWMGLKSLSPKLAVLLKSIFNDREPSELDFQSIPHDQQIQTAETALRMMGLVENFAPVVVFCGHAGACQNNPFASTLDCGACGGNRGGPNARILAAILNQSSIRTGLSKRGIQIPWNTIFIGAEHNTTTDEVEFIKDKIHNGLKLDAIKKDLIKAGELNRAVRDPLLNQPNTGRGAGKIKNRSIDWSEVRPEWGLGKNAAFLVGPRWISEGIDLQGRCFLHSYDYTLDPGGILLETILTAPMVVAEWINTQYFFSTIDPVAYGSGSKITHNAIGKFGVMQGNGSDLMSGLPVESLFVSDDKAYHDPLRLLTVVYAPIKMIDSIIERQPILQKLFFNEWVKLASIDPETKSIYNYDVQRGWNLS